LIVPLDCQGALQGIVVLQKPAGVGALNFEDHDILKTAGRQIGVVLGQAIALEKLAETRQFEAMNKLSTFLMHDLKNIVAQQELVVANAQRFKHRPDFVDDAFATIRSSVERMKRVLDQLREAAQQKSISQRADMSKAIVEARSACSDRNPVPELAIVQKQYLVPLDREKLVSALTHLIRNAQDATPPDGRICITLTEESDDLVLAVQDTGCGMNEAFVRDRLFRPFDSTKGARGMGIGAYQVREIIRAAGGDVEVQSEVGRGTRFGIRLPRLQA
jgi:putative PEP-CTERM system histidine kinase